jgi:anaerobic selenocysteine-containing dehydrogenase
MGIETHKTFCRFCHANCAMLVDVEDKKIVEVRGDPDDPVFGGYTCIKGRQLPDAHNSPERLTMSLVRRDGEFVKTPMPEALAHIGDRLQDIIAEHGPNSVAIFFGSGGFQNSAGMMAALSFCQGLGTRNYYTSVTLDQPAKVFTVERYGKWMGGVNTFADADVAFFIGNNPLVSHYAPVGGLPPFSPSRRLRDKQKDGLKLIVADPRESDVGAIADIYLQVKPGEDPALLAGMLNVIFEEELYDRNFVAAHVDGVEELQEVVSEFTPEFAAERAGVEADQIRAAARVFANASKGCAVTGTGPEMAGNGTLTEYLANSLNILCARFAQEGEKASIPGVFTGKTPRRAQVAPPAPMYGEGFAKSRFRDMGVLGVEMPCNVLADEILTPGEGQVRALISIGGNPEIAFPNQLKMRRALDDLDLFVQVDPWMSASAKRADVVLAPAMCLEREDITNLSEWWHERPYARYTEAFATPPGDTIDEYEMMWHLAKHLGVTMTLPGGEVPMDECPDKETFLDLMTEGCLVPPSQVRADSKGGEAVIYDDLHPVVGPADPEQAHRFNIAAGAMPSELAKYAENRPAKQGYEFKLISRRSKHRFNSIGHMVPKLREARKTNPAFIHPDDLAELSLADGDIIEIASPHASIHGIVQASDKVRRGIVSMAHAFGDSDAGKDEVREIGGSTNRLTSDEVDIDPLTGQALQSAIPVRISAA